MEPITILLIEDEDGDAKDVMRLVRKFRDVVAKVHRTVSLKDGIHVAANASVDVCLLDLTLPDAPGIDTVVQFLEACPLVPVVVMTGHDDIKFARQSVAYGAQDYLVKGNIRPRQMELVIETARERKRCALVGERLTHAALSGFEAEGKDAATVGMVRDAISEIIAAEKEKMRYLSQNAPEHIAAMKLIDETREIPSTVRFIQETMQIADQRDTPVGGVQPSLVSEAARRSVAAVEDRSSRRATVTAKRRKPTDPPEANDALLDIIERRSSK